MQTDKEAMMFTQHRYASETILNTVKLAIPTRFANTVDALARNLTFGSIPHEGARIIASELSQAGYSVVLKNLFDDEAVEKAKNAQLILISAMDIGLDQSSKIIKSLEPRDNLIVGGVGMTPVISSLAKEFPWVTFVFGEAENLISQAVSDFETKGSMENLYQRQSKFEFLELAHHPSSNSRFSCRELPMFKTSPLKVTEVSRGCPEACEFCPTALQPVTVKPLSLLEKEIDQMKLNPANVLFFVDQNLMACPQPYLHDLLDVINKKGVKWIGEGTISYVMEDELLLRKMAQNCLTFLIGIEDMFSPIKGSATKNKLQRDFEPTVARLRELKVPIIYSMVFGLDNQEREIFDLAADKVNRLGITVAAHLATPRPGTAFWNRINKEGRLLDRASIRRNMRNDVVFDPLHMTREDILRGFGKFQRSVYSPEQVARRFANNLTDCGTKYALGLAVTDSVYMFGALKFLQKHSTLFRK